MNKPKRLPDPAPGWKLYARQDKTITRLIFGYKAYKVIGYELIHPSTVQSNFRPDHLAEAKQYAQRNAEKETR